MELFASLLHSAATALKDLERHWAGTSKVVILLISALLAIVVVPWGHLVRQAAAKTQPRASSTPTKDGNDRKEDAAADPDGLASLFPPSRRHVLSAVLPMGEKGSAGGDAVPLHLLQERALPTTREPPASDGDDDDGEEAAPEHYSPTGVTLREIRGLLGTFPDYAVLSGVPAPRPCPAGFDLGQARFRPFRPFRWRYHQHMALMKLDPDYWLELERGYAASLAARRALLAEHGERILFCGPGAGLACRELLEMALQFLCVRYPAYFSLEGDEGDEGHEGESMIFVNRVLGTRTPLGKTAAGTAADDPRHPLRVLFDNVPEDFAVMLRDETSGRYYLRAAAVCSSVGWHVGLHRDEPLRAIHGGVTDYAEKMARSMDRYFARLPADQPVQRGSWSIEDGEPFFEPDPERRSRFVGGGGGGGADAPSAPLTVDDLRLRCDWQTLRRLPLTGAVVFNFKAAFTPLAALRAEPYVPALLHRVLRDGDPRLVVPGKCMLHARAAALPALAAWAAEQVAAGQVPAGWEPRTLDESPFYPGWEERWSQS